MKKLNSSNNTYVFTSTKNFNKIHDFKSESIKLAFDFAYNMSFGGKGEHRNHRSGGDHKRKNGEIFINAFQGKLAEFGIFNEFHRNKIEIEVPDLETYELGKWDKYDFEVNDKKIAVKSTKNYGQLLLLETKDWTSKGEYKPNLSTGNAIYDYFILVRVSPSGEDIMKKNKMLYSNEIDKFTLEKIITSELWAYDIPGFINNKELVYAIENKFILPKLGQLGAKTKMDAENYYIQTGDMHDINEIFKLIKN
ncbi:hypothetical protein FDE77_12340 [Clostridium botulinum]|nr:hypothetical protein [Clostridium botulinum]